MAVTVASGIPAPARRRGYALTAGVLLVMMLGGTLPVPLYVLYEKQMGFGPLGVTVVFAAYVVGTLFALVALGDLSDHIGRRKVLAIAVACAAVSTALFLAASGIGLLIAARVVSGTGGGIRHRYRHRCPGRAPAARRPPGRRGGRLREQHDRAGPRAADRRAVRRVRGHANPQRVLGLPGRLRAGARRARAYPRDGREPRRRHQPPAAHRRSAADAGRHARGRSRRIRRVQCPGAVQQPGAHLPARNTGRAQPRPDRRRVLPDLHHRRDQPGGLRSAAEPPQREYWAAIAARMPRRARSGAFRQGAVALPGGAQCWAAWRWGSSSAAV